MLGLSAHALLHLAFLIALVPLPFTVATRAFLNFHRSVFLSAVASACQISARRRKRKLMETDFLAEDNARALRPFTPSQACPIRKLPDELLKEILSPHLRVDDDAFSSLTVPSPSRCTFTATKLLTWIILSASVCLFRRSTRILT